MARYLLFSVWLIAVIHGLAILFSWYYLYWWFDIPMHLAGGAWVAAAAFFYLTRVRRDFLPQNRWVVFVVGLGIVALTGVVWEWYEFLADVFIFKKHSLMFASGSILFDTLKDLFNDLVGAAVTLLILVRKR